MTCAAPSAMQDGQGPLPVPPSRQGFICTLRQHHSTQSLADPGRRRSSWARGRHTSLRSSPPSKATSPALVASVPAECGHTVTAGLPHLCASAGALKTRLASIAGALGG
eukprot:242006-Chlamydomonas_euryale.AAC.6